MAQAARQRQPWFKQGRTTGELWHSDTVEGAHEGVRGDARGLVRTLKPRRPARWYNPIRFAGR